MSTPVRLNSDFDVWDFSGGGGFVPDTTGITALPVTFADTTHFLGIGAEGFPLLYDTSGPTIMSVKVTAGVDPVGVGLGIIVPHADVATSGTPWTWETWGVFGGLIGFPFWLRLYADNAGHFHLEVYDVDPVTTPGLWDSPPGGTVAHPAINTETWTNLHGWAGAFPLLLLQCNSGGATVTVDDWFAAPAAGPATITVVATPSSIPANGHSTSTLTATVRDSGGAGVSGETVIFSITSATPGAPGSLGPVTDNHDGTYTCIYTSTDVVADINVIASDGGLNAATVVHQTDAPDTITVSAKPATIVADGVSQSTVTALVKDTNGNPVAGQTVAFADTSATVGAAGSCGATTDNGDGSYTCTYTSTVVAGDVTVTASDGVLAASCVIHQTPTAVGNMAFGPPKHGIVRQGRS